MVHKAKLVNDQISMMYSAWGIYTEQEGTKTPIGLVLFSGRDKSVHLYRLNFPDGKIQELAESICDRLQKWIDKQKSPSSLMLESSLFPEDNHLGYRPWTDEFWEEMAVLFRQEIRIQKFQ